jgi:CBS domain-containing protein
MGNVESKPEEEYGVFGALHSKVGPSSEKELTGGVPKLWEGVRTFIENSTLKDVVKFHHKPLVSFSAQEDLHSCYNRLVEHGIHAAPVYAEGAFDDGLGGQKLVRKWIGLLDWRGFVHYVIQFLDEGERLFTSLAHQTAGDIAKDHPLLPVFEDASLLAILAGFGQQGVRRRPVVAKEEQAERILGMVSQLDVVRWLSRQRKELSPAFHSISIQHVVEKEQTDPRFSKLRQVCSVMKDTQMADVLRLLDNSNLNGLSVVDHAGKLVANISVSDLQYVVDKNLDNLLATVEQFLERVPRRPLITCSPTATLMDVIDKLAEAEVYRLYVVNEDGEPIAVITLTDIINAVMLLATHDATIGTHLSAK